MTYFVLVGVKSLVLAVRRRGLPLKIFSNFQNRQTISHACFLQGLAFEHMCENGQSSKFSTNFVRLIPLILSPLSTSIASAAYYCFICPAAVKSWLVFREQTRGVKPKSGSSSQQRPHLIFSELTMLKQKFCL